MALPSWSEVEGGYDYYKNKVQPKKVTQRQFVMTPEQTKIAKTIDPVSYYSQDWLRRMQTGEGINAPISDVQGRMYGDKKTSGDTLAKIKKDIFPQTPSIGKGGFSPSAQGTSSPYGDITGRQKSLADVLRERAYGNTPSIAATAAQQAQDKNVAQAMALAMSQPSSALGRRAVMQQQATAGQQIARDLANARLAEMEQAQAQYSGLLGGMAGVQNQRDIAEMGDIRARELAQAQLKYDQDVIRAQINRSLYGAGFDALGAGFQVFSDWLKSNPGKSYTDYSNEMNAANVPTTGGIAPEYPPSFSDSIDNYPPGESGIYDLPSTAPYQPSTTIPTSEGIALRGSPQYYDYRSTPFYNYRRY